MDLCHWILIRFHGCLVLVEDVSDQQDHLVLY